jgi:hypothetical protein
LRYHQQNSHPTVPRASRARISRELVSTWSSRESWLRKQSGGTGAAVPVPVSRSDLASILILIESNPRSQAKGTPLPVLVSTFLSKRSSASPPPETVASAVTICNMTPCVYSELQMLWTCPRTIFLSGYSLPADSVPLPLPPLNVIYPWTSVSIPDRTDQWTFGLPVRLYCDLPHYSTLLSWLMPSFVAYFPAYTPTKTPIGTTTLHLSISLLYLCNARRCHVDLGPSFTISCGLESSS